jgi:hypothetical protein
LLSHDLVNPVPLQNTADNAGVQGIMHIDITFDEQIDTFHGDPSSAVPRAWSTRLG